MTAIITLPTPSIGRIVQFRITEHNAKQINHQRTQAGHATKTGNVAREGDVYPLLIVRVWGGDLVNGQLFLDGNDSLWITSQPPAKEYGQLGAWFWPELF